MAKLPFDPKELERLVAKIRLQVGTGLRTPTEKEIDQDALVVLRKGQWHELLLSVDWLIQKTTQKRKDASAEQFASYLRVTEKLEQARRNGSEITEAEAIRRVGGTKTKSHYYAVKRSLKPFELPE